MSGSESPELSDPTHRVTVEDISRLASASTPHFALQVRDRISRLISQLPDDDPARIEGERQINRLADLGRSGEVRGTDNEPTIEPLRSVTKQD